MPRHARLEIGIGGAEEGRGDGKHLHRPGVLITDMAVGPGYYDAPGPWRKSTMNGQLHSGVLVDDPRSRALTQL